MGEHPSTHTPVTYDSCAHIEGLFYHGTKTALAPGIELVRITRQCHPRLASRQDVRMMFVLASREVSA